MTTIAQVKLSRLRYGYTLSTKPHFAQMVDNSTQWIRIVNQYSIKLIIIIIIII